MAAADLDTINSTQVQGVQYLGLIVKALQSVAAFSNFVAAPATATSKGTPGQVAYDSTHLYLCVQTNVWVRVALATF